MSDRYESFRHKLSSLPRFKDKMKAPRLRPSAQGTS